MPVLAMNIIKEVRDLDDQMTTFLVLAFVVTMLSWALIKLSKWLAIVADLLALISAWVILHELWSTEGWLDHSRGETLEPTYVRVAMASAVLPFLAITALLIVRKGRPNQALPTTMAATDRADAPVAPAATAAHL